MKEFKEFEEFREFKNENASKNAVIAANWKRPSLTTPPLHYSITPLLHYSITPLLHHFATSPLRHFATSPLRRFLRCFRKSRKQSTPTRSKPHPKIE
jgi:hypothetical protein